jgi:beta-glucosidase
MMKRLRPLWLCLSLVSTSALSSGDAALEAKIEQLLSQMTLSEKIGQTQLRDWGSYKAEDMDTIKQAVREGKVGGFLNVSLSSVDNNAFAELQRIALESPRKIPLLFGQDVIHGYKTIFPIPLGQAASFSPSLVEAGARVAAREASADGVRWTFAPMIDIARDPRWGRIAESLGEDPLLTSRLGVAMIKGFQTDDPTNPTSMAASAKHFIGYGAAEAGRDYNAAYIADTTLHDVYLRPFKAGVDAGLMTIMSSYNTLNDVPATANDVALKTILRKQWGFDGFVVTDWNAVLEMIPHGFARDAKQAAELTANNGIDMEMYTDTLETYVPSLLKEKKFSSAQLDDMVRNLLRIKLRLGLWEHPFPNGNQAETWLSADNLQAAQASAEASFVLLKNNGVLPLTKNQRIAVIGPLADAPLEQLGTWVYDGKAADTRTFLPALKQYLGSKGQVTYSPGLSFSRDHATTGFAEAINNAKAADVIIYVGGEEAILSGEGHSRGDIRLPGAQAELIAALKATGKPVVFVLMAGRPIQLDATLEQSAALLMAWHPGTMGGPALTRVLFGETSPQGRLPLSWPVAVGQIPIYYNRMQTGRPASDSNYTRIDKIEQGVWQHQPGNSSNHLDLGHEPLFPFGFGLTYSKVEYSKVSLSRSKLKQGESLRLSATITNKGKHAVTEIVQLYTQDKVGSLTRPIRELQDFQAIALKPGERKQVSFTLNSQALAFHQRDLSFAAEAGEFAAWIAPHAQAGDAVRFDLQ